MLPIPEVILKLFRKKPPVGLVNLGDLRRLTPICNNWGFSRGQVIGRYYVEQFLRKHAGDVSGAILEFGDSRYRALLRQDRIERYDVLDLTKRDGVTITGDIQSIPVIADATYDAIICTQVLEHVPNPFSAVGELQRILKKGGVLLLTVPHINKIHRGPGDYWRFTEDSLTLLLKAFSDLEIEAFGNVLTTALFGYGISSDELTQEELNMADPEYPVIFGCFARR